MSINYPFTLSELIDGGKGKKIKLEKLQNDKMILFVISAAITLISLLLLLWAWVWYKSDRMEIENQFHKTLQTPSYMYETAIKLALAQEYLLVPAVSSQLDDQIRKLPVHLGGWSLSLINCEGNKCQLTWHSKGGTFDDFTRSAPKEWGKVIVGNQENVSFGDLQTLQHELTLNLKSQNLPLPKSWPTRDDFVVEIGVILQKLKDPKWNFTLRPIVQQAIPAQITPADVANHPNAIRAMPWSLSQANWPLTQEIFSILGSNLTIDKFSFLINEEANSVTFSASGLAYVRK